MAAPTRPRPAGAPRARPASWPRSRSCCWPTTATLPLRRGRRDGASSGRAPTTRSRCSGCYSFPNHVGCAAPRRAARHRGADRARRAARTSSGRRRRARAGLRRCSERRPVRHRRGGRGGRATADVCVAVLGDRAGLFGRGTSGEGCDAADLRAARACRASCSRRCWTPARRSCSCVVSGRPYALGRYADRLPRRWCRRSSPARRAARALAGVLSGRVEPVRPAAGAGSRAAPGPAEHLPAADLGGDSGEVSNLDPTPLFPFGHGLSYTTVRRTRTARSRPSEMADRRCGRDRRATVRNSGRPRRHGGRAALPARPGRRGHPAGAAARRLRAGRRSSPGERGRVRSRCTPTSRRSPAATCAASSSRARSGYWSARRAATSAGRAPSG